ncbi:putative anti-sigma factor antagonist [alpha proteobacterium BAL199]|jgi:stage II sporulation protein AA (anti-sigma F factor antagonist)|nr:putative anti-sigma factor antagonist [alpha proteobacterium BAL199]
MTMTIESQDGLAIVVLTGRLDSTNAADTEAKIVAQIEAGHKRVVVDASALDYLSSAGLRVFLVVAKRVKAAGGGLVLHSLTNHVREVFEISGFINVLTVCANRDEAVARV